MDLNIPEVLNSLKWLDTGNLLGRSLMKLRQERHIGEALSFSNKAREKNQDTGKKHSMGATQTDQNVSK